MDVPSLSTRRLSGVAETLLIPLYARSRAARWHPGFRDPMAEAAVGRIDHDFSRIEARRRPQIVAVLRAQRIDEWARADLSAAPGALLVNLGAGLCTRFHRLDDGALRGWDVDFPEVIELKARLFPPNDRYRQIASSILDFRWLDDAIAARPASIVITAEGVLHYLAPSEVQSLFERLEQAPVPIRLSFDFYPPWLVRSPSARAPVKAGARLRWGLRSAADLRAWAPRLRVVDELRLFPEIGRELPLYRLLSWIPVLRNAYRLARVELAK